MFYSHRKKKKVVTTAKETDLMVAPVIQKEIERLKRLKLNEKEIFICFNQFMLDQEVTYFSAWADRSLSLLNNVGS